MEISEDKLIKDNLVPVFTRLDISSWTDTNNINAGIEKKVEEDVKKRLVERIAEVLVENNLIEFNKIEYYPGKAYEAKLLVYKEKNIKDKE